MKCKVIINPVAGKNRTEKLWPAIKRELERLNIDFTPVFTQKRGDAQKLASLASSEFYQLIVVVGGDGTVHEVINGINCGDIPISIIPTGLSNDFSRSLNYPSDWRAACRIIKNGFDKKIDLGKTGNHYFINAAGIGIDAQMAYNKRRRSGKKPQSSLPLFLNMFFSLWKYKPLTMKITLDSLTVEAKALLTAVANGRYYGSGMKIAPLAVLNDGLFDVCIISNKRKWDFMHNLKRIYQGLHLNDVEVSLFHTKTIRIETEKPVIFHLDGERVGTTPVDFSIVPQAVTIRCAGVTKK